VLRVFFLVLLSTVLSCDFPDVSVAGIGAFLFRRASFPLSILATSALAIDGARRPVRVFGVCAMFCLLVSRRWSVRMGISMTFDSPCGATPSSAGSRAEVFF